MGDLMGSRRTGFIALGMMVIVVSAVGAAEQVQAAPLQAAAPAFEILLDTSEAPQFNEFGRKIKAIAEEWYPRIAAELAGEGFTPPRTVRLIFKKDYKGIAFAIGNTITFSPHWFTQHPDDYGVVVHELSHVIQSYPRGNPSWLVEGIADYIRWVCYEPHNLKVRIDPQRSKYTDSYQVAGKFLGWVEKTHGPHVVSMLNEACRKSKYSDELFKQLTGNELGVLWQNFIASLKDK